MAGFDPVLRSTEENGDFCCGEKPQKPREQEMHMVPGVLNRAPFFSGMAIVHSKMQEISLNDYKGQYLILLFYPYDFTFNCPTEMIQFNDRLEEFQKFDCDIVAISTDSEYAHLAWITTPRKQGGLGEMRIAVLSDKAQNMSKTYGVLNEREGISHKALFIVDTDQIIRHITISDTALARSVDEALRLLEACKFVDQFGNTCPAGPRERRSMADKEPHYFST